jgi:hypothetical protein
MQKLGPARARFHDLFDDLENHRVEVKFSRVMSSHDQPITEGNVLEAIEMARAERKAVSIEDATLVSFDCNIQQIKCAEFDVLYYGLFFQDGVVIFRSTCADVPQTPGYSNKQHKGNVGEGQFHISDKTYAWHRKARFYAEISYEQLLGHLSPA